MALILLKVIRMINEFVREFVRNEVKLLPKNFWYQNDVKFRIDLSRGENIIDIIFIIGMAIIKSCIVFIGKIEASIKAKPETCFFFSFVICFLSNKIMDK